MSTIDFRSAVIERSRRVPVVVDFWAEWCGPCRILGPIIEELATQAAGRWELVKLDTEAQPDVAQAFDIRGIPAVKMFHEGRVVAEFVGALPKEQVRRWLDENLPDPDAEALVAIVERWPDADPGDWTRDVEAYVAAHPDSAEGRLRLAQAVFAADPGRARELIAAAEGEGDADAAELAADLSALTELAAWDAPVPPRLVEHVDGAREALRTYDVDRALEHLVDATATDRKFGEDLTRRAAVALFHLLGQQHELTRTHQRRLAMVLNV
jgi:putative thioredoxin